MESIKALAEIMEVMRTSPRRTYDVLSENSYLLSKTEVVDIAKELLYAIYSFCPESQVGEMMTMVTDELEYLYKEDLDRI